ncbi:patatin-like phospholipase family protein [Xylella taiwanensis]|uniref:Patatin n=1 Tax=Xylella taiwanensis TaxID=1444770 RepID=Z9JI08_9GAMM|nr:patatin-like phospholipase family protein [Xylella taiwanensis]AXI82521.1 Patatin [Xylella taiwanensis]EWS77392.1 Patatin [Xylella taiwanensis]MCD8455510.1 patatin-like phospholipase family protein [Xylella taiwanensis]MCD8457917.1 patatin-like phospholipase family protein [Xylella taiwanensis]MCD8460052.1 patatin-like phospholipase family protein [Xylella taiwanensis]
MRFTFSLPFLATALIALLTACSSAPRSTSRPPLPQPSDISVPPVRIGVALGGGAAKGFAHIGVLKMLEANGFAPSVVAGTSAGSVVGALYASGMDAFKIQTKAVALDESNIRDLRLFSGGLVQGQKLQDYVNEQVGKRPIEKLNKPFAAIATRLEDGQRTMFIRGNVGEAVRASCSIPGVFEPVAIGGYHYVDGGIASPIPVDAARQLGADFVIAVDISSKASGKNPGDLVGTVNQSISIMGQRLGEAELKRANVVIQPKVLDIGPTDFDQRNAAILEGERATIAVIPQIRAKLAQLQQQRIQTARKTANQSVAEAIEAYRRCQNSRTRWEKLRGKEKDCSKLPP